MSTNAVQPTSRVRWLRAPIVVSALVLASGAQASGAQASGAVPSLPELDRYIETAIARWDVPALSIAIVKDDRVVHMRGYGVLERGKPERVTEHTIFGIGSTTKAFTSAALAMMVDAQKLRWDDRVVDHLRDFRLYDPYATANITVRDLLSHTSGLSRGDRMWYARSMDRKAVVDRVRYQEPSWTLRQQYGYSNTMFTAAGLVLESVAAQSWDDFLRARIFEPLGMRRTSTTVIGLEKQENVAASYTMVGAKAVPIPRWNQDNIGPAGALNSTASDLAQWVRFQLARGTYGGRTLIRPERFNDMHGAQMVVRGGSSVVDPPLFNAYGMGWRLQEYRGRMLVSHTGGGHGVDALVALVPQERLGVVILSNADANNLPTALSYHVIDQYLGGPSRDWGARFLANRDSSVARSARAEERLQASRARGTSPTLALDAYVGRYSHPYYGIAEARRTGDRLHFRFVEEIEGPLEHWHHDTFRAMWTHPRYGSNFLTFRIGANGAVESVNLPPEADTSYRVDFRKLPPETPARNP